MPSNSNLNKAKDVKNDEFYTQMTEIENELAHYKSQFKGKIVYCNCDDPSFSNFYKYFKKNFKALGLKKLVSTYYGKKPYVTTYNGSTTSKRQLKGNGSFDSPECLKILLHSDIVVTNPPFSLFRAFIDTLMSAKVKFLIIGSLNAITYMNVFPYIKSRKIKLGYNNGGMAFDTPSGKVLTVPVCWYTNMTVRKTPEKIKLTEKYTKANYPKCDNCNCINVNAVADIPKNYNKTMGVPISYLTKENPKQFKITDMLTYCKLGKKNTYKRLLIKKV